MRTEEIERFVKVEQSVEEIRTDISVIKSALIGNELSGDKGVVGKVFSMEAEIEALKKEIKELQESKTTVAVYIKALLWVTGLVTTIIVGYIANIILK